MRALERVDFKHPFDQSGPTRSRPARFGLGGRSCLTDKPPVDLHFARRRLLGVHSSAAIRIPSEISDEMFSLVWDVLREFREEIERVENLKVAAGVGKRRQSPFCARYTTEPDSVTRTILAKLNEQRTMYSASRCSPDVSPAGK